MYKCEQRGIPFHGVLPEPFDKAYDEVHLSIIYRDLATKDDVNKKYVEFDPANSYNLIITTNEVKEGDYIYRIVHTGSCSPGVDIMNASYLLSNGPINLEFNYVIYQKVY